MKLKTMLVASALAFSLAGAGSTFAAPRHVHQAVPAAKTAVQTPAVQTPAVKTQATNPDLKAFPAPTAGQVRHVITLPALEDESLAKVELIVGRTMMIDCNNHMFGGQLQERTAEGWGYSYFVLENLGPAVSTMMGCINQPQRQAFVRSSQEALVRYNSRLPLVVYAPADVELRYQIWRAEPQDLQVISAN